MQAKRVTYLQVVLFEPSGEGSESVLEAVNTLNVSTGEIRVEVLVDLDGSVVQRVGDFAEVLGRGLVTLRGSGPDMSSSVSVSGSRDHLLSTSRSDGSNSSLVVLEDQSGRHVMGLVHQSEAVTWNQSPTL
jgi:hypothetical protein